MPSLSFKGKAFVQNAHLAVPFHELVPSKAKSLTKKVSLHDNLIIHGDNLKALKALLPTYAGKVKCVYIDPPYNTGNEHWAYNDNVNSPMMQEWLGKVVDREDLTRHDKWLCMMTPRLKLLRELLKDDGVLLVSIGDDELGSLLLLLREVFSHEEIAVFCWKSRQKPTNAGEAIFRPQKVAEYVIAIGSVEMDDLKIMPIAAAEKRTYPHSDEKGSYRTTTILSSNLGSYARETMRVKIGNYAPPKERRWKFGNEEILRLHKQGYIGFRNDKPYLKVYEKEEKNLHIPLYTFLDFVETGTAESGKTELNQILGDHGLDTVKPRQLISFLVKVFTSSQTEDVILDSFAGSGTTAHAVLALNNEDGGNRKFVLIEMEDYADKITAERVRRVIKGVPKAKNEALKKGLGGTFSYFELGKPIELEGILSGDRLPAYEELARYVFYTATGEEFVEKAVDRKRGFIGASKDFDVYLLYEPDLDYLKKTALTLEWARGLGKGRGGRRRLVFAPTKYLNQEHLDEFRIDFAQLPFEIYRLTK